MKRLALALALLWSGQAAATEADLYVLGNDNAFHPVTSSLPVNVTGSFSASIGGFAPNGNIASLSVTNTTGRVALPSGVVVIVSNTGSNTAFIKLGDTSVTATTGDFPLPSGAAVSVTVGANVDLAAITAASTTTLQLSGGAGLFTGFGASSGGGGGGTSSNFAAAFPAAGTAIGVKNGANMVNLTADGSGNLNTTLATGLPAGSATIGNVGLVAGTALVGKFGIDQTTPGTTNAVQANAGTNLNTSLLALESGGNLATIAGAISSSVAQVNTKQVNGVTTLAGAGAVGTGAQRVAVGQDTTTIAGSAPGTAGTPSSNVVSIQGVSSGTVVPISGSVTPGPATSGGLSLTSKQVANNTTSVAIKASSGQLYGIEAFNNSATIAYIKLYDASQGSTTCGSGTPVYRGMIPSNSTSGSGYASMNAYGLVFSTAITLCVTTGFADNDTTAPAASAYIVNALYK